MTISKPVEGFLGGQRGLVFCHHIKCNYIYFHTCQNLCLGLAYVYVQYVDYFGGTIYYKILFALLLRFNFDTAYQYLEARFNRLTRWVAATLFLFFMVSRIAIVLFLPSLALNAVTGFSVYYSILIMSIVTIIYSTSGGMEAVVWGDVIQGFILIVGAFAALVFMLMGVEGGYQDSGKPR